MRTGIVLSMLATGCVGYGQDYDGPPPCLPNASELAVQLHVLGYGEFDTEPFDDAYYSGAEPPRVFVDEASWTSFATMWDFVAPTVDFGTQVVFANPWVFDGCNPGPDYSAWIDGDALRFVIHPQPPPTVFCDLGMPTVDVLIVDSVGASDVDYCSW